MAAIRNIDQLTAKYDNIGTADLIDFIGVHSITGLTESKEWELVGHGGAQLSVLSVGDLVAVNAQRTYRQGRVVSLTADTVEVAYTTQNSYDKWTSGGCEPLRVFVVKMKLPHVVVFRALPASQPAPVAEPAPARHTSGGPRTKRGNLLLHSRRAEHLIRVLGYVHLGVVRLDSAGQAIIRLDGNWVGTIGMPLINQLERAGMVRVDRLRYTHGDLNVVRMTTHGVDCLDAAIDLSPVVRRHHTTGASWLAALVRNIDPRGQSALAVENITRMTVELIDASGGGWTRAAGLPAVGMFGHEHGRIATKHDEMLPAAYRNVTHRIVVRTLGGQMVGILTCSPAVDVDWATRSWRYLDEREWENGLGA